MSGHNSACRPEYLCVDQFLQTLIDARALASAFELGVIDLVADGSETDTEALGAHLELAPWALNLLLDLLKANNVLERRETVLTLTDAFRTAIKYRDLLEAKLDFAASVLPDFSGSFTQLLSQPDEFVQTSRVFELFRYDRCIEINPENLEHTRRWMRYTTALTKYEAGACMQHFDFASNEHVLDIGGNSGEFMLRICRAYPGLRATVFDLPVVCEIGKQHLASQPEASRIQFQSGDARRDPLPDGHDLITFKSVLHDWPEADALELLGRAVQVLRPGGTLLVFERGALEIRRDTPPYSMIPNLLFAGYYRPPGIYARQMEALGLRSVDVIAVELEMTFHIVTAVKSA